MIRLLGNVPREIGIAFSGGVDSLAAAYFLNRSGRNITLLHFNHGCEFSDRIEEQCVDLAFFLGLPIICSDPIAPKPAGMSLEAYWREERYKFLRHFRAPVVTAHHLDDAVETWVWSALHGKPTVIPKENEGIIRPFLLTEKAELVSFAERHKLTPVDDPYNREGHLIRNYIRSNLLPHAYYVNPGLKKVIKKKYLGESNA